MIRSPPPTTWPRSPNSRVFRFPGSDYEDDSSQESLVGQSRGRIKSPVQNEHSSPKRSRSVMDSSTDFAGILKRLPYFKIDLLSGFSFSYQIIFVSFKIVLRHKT